MFNFIKIEVTNKYLRFLPDNIDEIQKVTHQSIDWNQCRDKLHSLFPNSPSRHRLRELFENWYQ